MTQGTPDFGPPPAYGPPTPSYGYPTQSYGWSPYGYDGDGTVGQVRGTGKSILLFFVTFGIYSYIYNFQVHSEMKRHSGRGIGGGIALLLSFLAGIAMPFVTPAEVGSLYSRRGQQPPVSGWTGLWTVVPMVAGYIGLFGALIVASAVSAESDDGGVSLGITVGVVLLAWAIGTIVGGIVWFMRTNDALNDYWISLGATAS